MDPRSVTIRRGKNPYSLERDCSYAVEPFRRTRISTSEELDVDRFRDHCHLTDKFRGAAHNACNLNLQFPGRIPVILHILGGYDSHLIMQGAGKLKNKTIIAFQTIWKSIVPSQLATWIFWTRFSS